MLTKGLLASTALFLSVSAAHLFEVVPGSAAVVDGGLSRGVAFADADGDRDPDLLVANTINYPEFLYRNDDTVFVQVMETAPSLSGGYSEGVNWIDFDNDGDADVFVTRTRGPNVMYRNDGDWSFSIHDVGALTADHQTSSMACWADIDSDGWLDVFVVNRRGENDAIYRNVNGVEFERVRAGPAANNGGDGRSCAFGDADGDGDPDLYVGNFIDTAREPASAQRNYLYMNQGAFGFSEMDDDSHVVQSTDLTYGTSWTDVDSDGDLDLFVTNIGLNDNNHLYLNDGSGKLTLQESVALGTSGAPSKGHAWGDFDLDGDIDIAIANGTEGTDQIANELYLNDGKANFKKVSTGSFVTDRNISAGLAWADYDSDGDLDLFVANWGDGDEDNALYRNTATGTWLKVSLSGTESSRLPIGAIVTIEAGGLRQVRSLYPQTGYGSQNEPILHFGLNGATLVDSLTVDWPSGQRDEYQDVAANNHLFLTEGSTRQNEETGESQ